MSDLPGDAAHVPSASDAPGQTLAADEGTTTAAGSCRFDVLPWLRQRRNDATATIEDVAALASSSSNLLTVSDVPQLLDAMRQRESLEDHKTVVVPTQQRHHWHVVFDRVVLSDAVVDAIITWGVGSGRGSNAFVPPTWGRQSSEERGTSNDVGRQVGGGGGGDHPESQPVAIRTRKRWTTLTYGFRQCGLSASAMHRLAQAIADAAAMVAAAAASLRRESQPTAVSRHDSKHHHGSGDGPVVADGLDMVVYVDFSWNNTSCVTPFPPSACEASAAERAFPLVVKDFADRLMRPFGSRAWRMRSLDLPRCQPSDLPASSSSRGAVTTTNVQGGLEEEESLVASGTSPSAISSGERVIRLSLQLDLSGNEMHPSLLPLLLQSAFETRVPLTALVLQACWSAEAATGTFTQPTQSFSTTSNLTNHFAAVADALRDAAVMVAASPALRRLSLPALQLRHLFMDTTTAPPLSPPRRSSWASGPPPPVIGGSSSKTSSYTTKSIALERVVTALEQLHLASALRRLPITASMAIDDDLSATEEDADPAGCSGSTKVLFAAMMEGEHLAERGDSLPRDPIATSPGGIEIRRKLRRKTCELLFDAEDTDADDVTSALSQQSPQCVISPARRLAARWWVTSTPRRIASPNSPSPQSPRRATESVVPTITDTANLHPPDDEALP